MDSNHNIRPHKGIGRSHFSWQGVVFSSFLLLLLGSCGEPNYCACLDEAKKEIPNQEVMQQCRDQFADMDEAKVKAAVENCQGK